MPKVTIYGSNMDRSEKGQSQLLIKLWKHLHQLMDDIIITDIELGVHCIRRDTVNDDNSTIIMDTNEINRETNYRYVEPNKGDLLRVLDDNSKVMQLMSKDDYEKLVDVILKHMMKAYGKRLISGFLRIPYLVDITHENVDYPDLNDMFTAFDLPYRFKCHKNKYRIFRI